MKTFLLGLGAAALLLTSPPARAATITLDPHQPGRVFEGIGAVSAGASSRLLIDYPEPQRSQILDYLFKPNYGASLQHLKVEIGGGVNSTDGTEPTHMRSASDQNYSRGYEWWLMSQAAARNTNIVLDCLAWGAPGWIGNGNYYSSDMCNYIVNFINGARAHYGLNFQFTGTHNESTVNSTWIKSLRAALNTAALQNVQIVAADEWGGTWNIVTNPSYGILVNPSLSNAIARIGAHYPGSASPASAQTCGKLLWSSEDGIGGSTWAAACKLGQIFNSNYINAKITATEIWSPITSYYDILPAADSGLMRANSPWSGNYEVAPAIWVTAHTTQFVSPGWTYLEGGASATLPAGGTMVSLMSTNASDYSIVAETFDADVAQTVTVRLTNGLSRAALSVWQTTETSQFVKVATVMPVNNAFSFTLQPGCIYTLSTTVGQTKGIATPPAAIPFPLPYKDNFESYAVPQTPKYFSDQAGTFETFTRADGQGQCLRQVLTQTGIRWTSEWQPYSLIGDANWTDYDVASDVLIESNGGWDFVMGRVGSVPGFADALPRGYWLSLNNAAGAWQLYAASNLIASGPASFPPNTWHNLRLAMRGNSLGCYIDNTLVTNLSDFTYVSGMAGIGCGWHTAQFDNFIVRGLHSGALNLSLGATASASSIWSSDYTAAMANDGDLTTRWNTSYPTLSNEWLELDFPQATTFNQTACSQYASRIFGYQIQHWTGSAWTTDFNGGTMAAFESDRFPAVTASKVRLLLTNMASAPSIFEFEVFDSASNQSPVTINEWMTDNTQTIADPANGQFEPWFELYNSGTNSVNLAGYHLAGSAANLYQFTIPAGFTIAPGGFLLVWTDGLTNFNQPGATDLHAGFSLQQSSIIGLLDSAGRQLDAVNLGYQPPDASSGSRMDGDSVILPLVVPTPRQSNKMIVALPPAISKPGGPVVLSFIGFPLATHQILSTAGLSGLAWSNTASVFSDGLGYFPYNETPSQSQRYFRAQYP
jgi:hypothetical protein